MKVTKLRIKNPNEFQNKFLASVDLITCEYKMKGASILDGIEITDITTKDIVVDIDGANSDTFKTDWHNAGVCQVVCVTDYCVGTLPSKKIAN